MTDIRVSPRNRLLLHWLKRKPMPARIVGETLEGDEVKAAVNQTGPAQWSDLVGVLRGCTKVQALDKDDQVLRVLELDPDDPELRAETETEAALRGLARGGGGGAAVPIISVDIPRLVDNIARNMREVASEAAKQQSGAFKEGFGAMVSVVNVCLSLLVRVENRLAEVEDAQHQQDQEAEATGPQTREQLASMALQRALGSNGAVPNGGGKFDPSDLLKLVQSLQQQQPNGGSDAHE